MTSGAGRRRAKSSRGPYSEPMGLMLAMLAMLDVDSDLAWPRGAPPLPAVAALERAGGGRDRSDRICL